MRWLKRFLSNGDPIVKLVGALSEPEAEMRKELLERGGVPAMVKDMGFGFSAYGATPPFGFDLFVKQSDMERAEELLGSLMDAVPREDTSLEDLGGQAGG
ncbi:MAG: DUF2007 domain-containing protein [Chloroflexi bacterium]|nr:DUF2007 domain-containing protein [Chloroflexota bacterium]